MNIVCEGCKNLRHYGIVDGKVHCFCKKLGQCILADSSICSDREEKNDNDIISHPSHYCYSKYEPKDVIRDWGLNFNLGSTVKYIARAGRKDDIIQDLKKAKQFLEFEIEALEEERKMNCAIPCNSQEGQC